MGIDEAWEDEHAVYVRAEVIFYLQGREASLFSFRVREEVYLVAREAFLTFFDKERGPRVFRRVEDAHAALVRAELFLEIDNAPKLERLRQKAQVRYLGQMERFLELALKVGGS